MRDFVFVKNNTKYSRIFFNDLQYIEAVDKYVRLVTIRQCYLVSCSLQGIEKLLPADQFCRIHRSFIISFRHTKEFTRDTVLVSDKELPLSKQYKTIFFKKALQMHNGNSNDDGINSSRVNGNKIIKKSLF